MARRQKITKQRQSARDNQELRKFLTIVAIATAALMVLMYLIFAG
jgi:hypothetical protein